MNYEQSREIHSYVRQIEIITRRLLSGIFSGDHRVRKKGFGLSFDQLREYQQGDDIRFIDWKSSARMNKMLVKEYFEEKDRSILVCVDISASMFYGSGKNQKIDMIRQIASILALVGYYGKDKVGILLFNDTIVKYIAPKRSLNHVHAIIKELFLVTKKSGKTKLQVVFDFLLQRKKREMIIFLLSDFFDDEYNRLLSLVAKWYDITVIRCLDYCEYTNLPYVGYVRIHDPELQKEVIFDTGKNNTKKFHQIMKNYLLSQDNQFKRCKVPYITITVQDDYLAKLVSFFRKRLLFG